MGEELTMIDRERLVGAAETRHFFGGCSDMWLWRRLNDPLDDFPRPIVISRRRFWRFAALIAYRDRMAERSVASATADEGA